MINRSIEQTKRESVIGRMPDNHARYGIETEPVLELSQLVMRTPEPSISKISAQSIKYGEKRGEALAKLLSPACNDSLREVVLERVMKLDQRFYEFTRNYQGTFRNDPSLLQELSDKARVAQDTIVFEVLNKGFFKIGKDLGEAQGRVVDTERSQRAQEKIIKFEEFVLGKLTLSPPVTCPVAESILGKDDSISRLQGALRASASRGERHGIGNRIEAEVEATHIYRHIAGWKEFLPSWIGLFKPFHAVQESLQGKKPDQIGYIDQALQERRGTGLTEALIHAFGKRCGGRIRWLTSGDEVGAAALSAARELKSLFTTKYSRGEGLRGVYEALSANDIVRFERLLASELRVSEVEIQDYVARKVTPRTAQKLQALRVGDAIRERVIHISDLLESRGDRKLDVRIVLRDLEGQELTKLAERYQTEFGQSLKDAIDTKLPDSAAKDLCLALLIGNQTQIAAARIKCALDYRADWIGAPFLETAKAERTEMIAAYEQIYHVGGNGGEFWQDLRTAVWREDYFILASMPSVCTLLEKLWWPCMNSYPFLESIALNGELRPAELLRYFMVGMGTDIDGIYAVLTNRTSSEIKAIESDYAAKFPPGLFTKVLGAIPGIKEFILIGDLRHDLRVELSGDHEFDISMLCDGLPECGDERKMCARLFERLEKRFKHEKSGVLLKNGLVNRMRGDGVVLRCFQEDYNAVVAYYRKYIEKQDQLAPEHVKRFCTLVRLAEIQAEAYRDAKVAVSTLVLNSGAFIGATTGAIGVLFFSSLPWWSAAAASGAGSLCWRWVQGTALLGRGFGKTDATFQAIRAFIDGASMFTIRVGVATMSGLLGRQISSGVAKGGFKTSLHKFIQSIENRIKRQDKARHVVKNSILIASDEQLKELVDGYLNDIQNNRGGLGADGLLASSRIEDVFVRALI